MSYKSILARSGLAARAVRSGLAASRARGAAGARPATTSAAPVPSSSCRTFNSMPLRAKLLSPAAAPAAAGAQRAHMSTSMALEDIRELPGDPSEDVLFGSLYGLRTIELNNQPKLNALDASMIRKIASRLREWSRSDLANVVVIKGAGPGVNQETGKPLPKAMCAGGDVMTLAKQNLEGPEGIQKSADYFALEYCLDHYIATYNKPYVAFMDGITMGGGVGLSVHAPFRIATERTVFAMPETNIGFFPDVGGTFFLPRMPGELGTYLALTSDRIKGSNVFYTGIATHYLNSAQLPALEQRLAELRFHDYQKYEERLGLVNLTIEEFATGMPWNEKFEWGGDTRQMIDACFCFDTVPEILDALGRLKEKYPEFAAWADRTTATLRQRSPTAVTVALRQLRAGRNLGWSISEVFKREHKLASRFMAYPDFTEGVMALLNKPRREPVWKPATLDDIENPESHSSSFYAEDELQAKSENTGENAGENTGENMGEGESATETTAVPGELELWNKHSDFDQYPTYRLKYGVPTEYDVYRVCDSAPRTPQEVLTETYKRFRGKQGIEPVVNDIVRRRAIMTDAGKCVIEPTPEEKRRKAADEEIRMQEAAARKAKEVAERIAQEKAAAKKENEDADYWDVYSDKKRDSGGRRGGGYGGRGGGRGGRRGGGGGRQW